MEKRVRRYVSAGILVVVLISAMASVGFRRENDRIARTMVAAV